MSVLKITNIGDFVGVILPDEILERLRVKRRYSLRSRNQERHRTNLE